MCARPLLRACVRLPIVAAGGEGQALNRSAIRPELHGAVAEKEVAACRVQRAERDVVPDVVVAPAGVQSHALLIERIADRRTVVNAVGVGGVAGGYSKLAPLDPAVRPLSGYGDSA